jgi:hypothetical protein
MMRATATLMRKNSVIPRTNLAEKNLSTFCARISIELKNGAKLCGRSNYQNMNSATS